MVISTSVFPSGREVKRKRFEKEDFSLASAAICVHEQQLNV